MTDRDQDRLLDHDYDGIQEFDNPMPRWWVGIFWATIIFSVLYLAYYQLGAGPSVHEKYDDAMIAYYDRLAAEMETLGEITDATLAGFQDDDSMMAGASRIYQVRCAQCHGALGEGNIGPNLTDPFWLHGGALTDIYRTVSEGVPAKGMLAWKTQLRPAELLAVSAYVGTLLGTEPPNPKPPQGEEWVPPAPPAGPAAETGDEGGEGAADDAPAAADA